jgi:adenine-specific DNA-methyltransferase
MVDQSEVPLPGGRDAEEFEPESHGHKHHFGQFYTPPEIASFMVGWLNFGDGRRRVRILDAGAGVGALSIAALSVTAELSSPAVEIVAVERDKKTFDLLSDQSKNFSIRAHQALTLVNDNFLTLAMEATASLGSFSHAVLNPPYVRLQTSNETDKALRAKGIAVPNLYAAFLWLALDLLEPSGELVAIIPRSFCNGPRFKAFRARLRAEGSIDALHVFGARDEVFDADGVLQETVIVKISKSAQGSQISLSQSLGIPREDVAVRHVASESVLETDGMIRIPELGSTAEDRKDWSALIPEGLSVSTGQVVDFRNAERISTSDRDSNVPLIDAGYGPIRSTNSLDESLSPKIARYLERVPDTEKFIFPIGNYVVVKRISPKEQSPRIRAAAVWHSDLADTSGVAFENHVNVIHSERSGLTEAQVIELLERLTSQLAESQFLELSGTTQVNVADLKALKYP